MFDNISIQRPVSMPSFGIGFGLIDEGNEIPDISKDIGFSIADLNESIPSDGFGMESNGFLF